VTIPIERVCAVEGTRQFLRKLMDPKETPKVPSKVRRMAYILIKHYPHPKVEFEDIWSGKEWDEVKDLIKKMKACSNRSSFFQ
jgi:hypothetical protein